MKTLRTRQSMDFIKDWESWSESISEGIEMIRKLRVTLNEKISCTNPEEQLLKELWNVSSPEERKTIAGVLLKLVQEYHGIFNNTCSFLSDSRNWYMWEEYEMADGGTPWA